jgi:hypothetical protein
VHLLNRYSLKTYSGISHMRSFRVSSLCASLLIVITAIGMFGQNLKHRPEKPAEIPVPEQPELPSIPLTVPSGTPLKVAIDKEIRIRRVGQPIHGKTTEPIYAFDKLLVPVGTEVTGKIAEIDDVSPGMRTLSAMNADFSPERKVCVEFDQLLMPDGRLLRIHTVVTPGAGVLQFVPAKETKDNKVGQGKAAAKGKLSQARQGLKQQITEMKKQVSEPNRVHRLERFALTQSPYRPQYMNSGSSFNADVQEPLAFGSEQLRPETVSEIGTLPPSGGTVHAWLTTPLDSATSKKGDPVVAMVSQPLVLANKLYLPEGSELKGTVLQVKPARRFARSGQLRIAFHEVVPPNGIEQKIEATLEGLEVTQGQNLALDSEGGAQVKTPKMRYLTTGIAVMLAAGSSHPDEDNGGVHGGAAGGAGGGALNGAMGFKLVGTLVGAFAHSQVLTAGFGAYGAARSVYGHFLARGRNVVYPKDMSMVLALGNTEKTAVAGTN